MYDPFVDSHPGAGQPHAQSYWVDTAGDAPADDGQIIGDIEVDVAIIGGGYTGLSCALHLARDFGVKAVVLEASQTAWGCSGRNGGFARISGGRVPVSGMIEKYGKKNAVAYFNEMRAGLDLVRSLIDQGNIDCDVQPDGVYKVASKLGHVDYLKREAELYQEAVGYDARFVKAADLQGVHGGGEAFGAMYLKDGFAMHPLKLCRGLQVLARSAGARVHPGSPVTGWQTTGAAHRLITPQGVVTARRVVVATNGYTSRQLNPELNGRTLPIHSQIIVTRPMNEDERLASLPGTECIFDTRTLLFYYRRLPDNRILFGGRGAISGHDAENPRHRELLLTALKHKFPALSDVTVDYRWGGWVAVTNNSLPHSYRVPNMTNVYAAGGYAGSGVSFSIQTGKRLAAMVNGDYSPSKLDFLHAVPKPFPLAPFFRIGQRFAYSYYRFKDAR